jgi:hypothetical protein
MSAFPNSPRLIKGGIVLVDPDSGTVQKIIVLQYNPDTLTRTLAPQGAKEGGDPLRLTGLRLETITLYVDRRDHSAKRSVVIPMARRC